MTDNKKTKFEIYKDNHGKFRWRLTSVANGQIVDASTQGFSSKPEARNNARRSYLGLKEEFGAEFEDIESSK